MGGRAEIGEIDAGGRDPNCGGTPFVQQPSFSGRLAGTEPNHRKREKGPWDFQRTDEGFALLQHGCLLPWNRVGEPDACWKNTGLVRPRPAHAICNLLRQRSAPGCGELAQSQRVSDEHLPGTAPYPPDQQPNRHPEGGETRRMTAEL